MVSYSLRCGLQRGYLSSYRFMLSFRDIYITLSSLGVLTLELGRQSHRDPSLFLFHFPPFCILSPTPTRSETVMIVTASKGSCCNSPKTKWDLVQWEWLGFTWRGLLLWLACNRLNKIRMSIFAGLIPTHKNLAIRFNKHTIFHHRLRSQLHMWMQAVFFLVYYYHPIINTVYFHFYCIV